VHDASSYAPARYFMMHKTANPARVETAGRVPLPGDPGRWTLPDDPSGLDALWALHTSLSDLSETQVTYRLLVCVSILILIARLVSLAVIQPHIAIIPLTLLNAFKDLVYLALVIVPLALLWAMLLVTTLGPRADGSFSSISAALYQVFFSCVTASFDPLAMTARQVRLQTSRCTT
jgi:hypothetical protein